MRYIALLALLAGCATTPKDVIEQGASSVHPIRLDPAGAAACIARNAENHSAGFVSTVRPLNQGNEVVVRINQAHVVVVAHTEITENGSRATIWQRGYLPGSSDLVAAMVSGC